MFISRGCYELALARRITVVIDPDLLLTADVTPCRGDLMVQPITLEASLHTEMQRHPPFGGNEWTYHIPSAAL